MRRALARILRARLDDAADLLKQVDEHVFLEGGERRLVRPQVEPRQKAQIDRPQSRVTWSRAGEAMTRLGSCGVIALSLQRAAA